MLGVGWTEMLVIGVVALIVIGPKDLPVVMHRIGKVLGSIRRMGSEFQREINRSTGLDQITDIRKSITEPLRQTAADIRKEFNTVTPTGATVPSGVIKPKDPSVESVVDEIHANLGIAAPETAKPVESPAPVEAIAPVAKPRKPRTRTATAKPSTKPTQAAKSATGEAPTPVKAAAPRKPRAKKPAADG